MSIPRSKTELENYLVYGIDEKYRRISFGHPIIGSSLDSDTGYNDFTDSSVELAVRAIRRMEKDHPKKPIEIYISSPGGDVEAMIYLKDVMLASTCKFKVFGGGKIQSAAVCILLVGDERYVYPGTSILVHGLSYNLDGDLVHHGIHTEENRRLQNQLEELYADNSFMPKPFWHEMFKRDLTLTPEEALSLGMIDEIIPYKKRASFRAKRIKNLSNPPCKKEIKKIVKKLYDRIKIPINLKNLEISVKKEELDPTLVVDDTPIRAGEPNEGV